MRFAIASLAFFALAAPALAQDAPAGAYVNDRTHTSLTWSVLHQGLSHYTARFTRVDIQLDFNPADVSKSKLSASVDPKSVETDYARTRSAADKRDFNADLAGENFFNATKFATVTFKSTKVAKTGANTGKVTGDLTLLGVTKPVTLDVTYVGHRADPKSQKHRLGFSATGVLKRSDFGMDYLSSIVGDEVRIQIETELTQK